MCLPLTETFQGYIFRIGGGNDKQGFPMKQGVLTNGRVRLLLSKGHSCYRPRKDGERKRKSVRGCVVDANLSALHLTVVKKGKLDLVKFHGAHDDFQVMEKSKVLPTFLSPVVSDPSVPPRSAACST